MLSEKEKLESIVSLGIELNQITDLDILLGHRLRHRMRLPRYPRSRNPKTGKIFKTKAIL